MAINRAVYRENWKENLLKSKPKKIKPTLPLYEGRDEKMATGLTLGSPPVGL
jgi:hypothetical protein